MANDALLRCVCLEETLHIQVPVYQLAVSEPIEVEVDVVVGNQLLFIRLQVLSVFVPLRPYEQTE